MTNENAVDGDSANKHSKTCVVLGGRGFIGRALVERLLKVGNWKVRVADSYKSPELKPSESRLVDALSSGHAAYFQVDVRDKSQIVEAIRGVSVVFFTDSMDVFPQDFYLCYKVIVQGAKNVVNACRECNVKRLIYNSSADVVFDDVHDIHGGDESLPYSGQFWDMVADLRTQAEALILSANDTDDLLTCALRPCNAFGPGDQQLIPLLVNMAKSNWDKFIIGSGNNLSDFTYVDNVAHAHVCAEESLSSQKETVSGKAFFITNLEPMKFRDFAYLFLGRLGYPRPFINLPAHVANHIFSFIKLLHLKSDPKKLDSSVSIYKLASCTRTFSCVAAQKHIQYSPIVSLEEALGLTVDAFSNLAIEPAFMRYKVTDGPSKIENLLGGGQVSDILLWRDEKKTFICFLLLGCLYHWFFLSGNTFISSLAQLLLLIIVLLCGHHVLSLSGYGSIVPRLSSSCFEISEVDVRSLFFSMKCVWDKVGCLIKLLAQGEDWSTFLKVASFMYVFKWIVSQYLIQAVGVALMLVFTLCFVYEQYEEKVDAIAVILYNIASKGSVVLARKLQIRSSKGSSTGNPLGEKGSNRSLLDGRQ
ncbi:hypothetical protein C2S53_012637 [Perilla frutescens var. hirtella]|uniref:Reticulon-like protein n=1 Tax=Perilla frutescens var. hirtella TaxID=608512 RepID=A0AAD4JHY4_PERFH|nr:hypothetical protein C2S53_012637 [Perilla frutescens var. hirtella]